MGPWLLEDSAEYMFAAANLVEHQTLYASDWSAAEHLDDYSKRPPLYPLLLIITSSYQGQLIALSLLQICFSILSIWLISRLIQTHIQETIPWGLWAVALLFTPGQWMYPSLVMTEIFFQLLLVLLGYALIRALASRKMIWWIAAAGFVIAGFLTKPILYLFAVVFLVMGLIVGWKRKRLLIPLITLVPVLSVLCYMSWNASRTGYFHVSSIQNLSLLQYTTTNLLIETYGEEEGIARADSILYLSLSQETYAREQQQLQASCLEVIASDLPTYCWMHVRGMCNFFLDPGRFDIWSFCHVSDEGEGLLTVFSQSGYKGVIKSLMQKPPGWLMVLIAVFVINIVKSLGMMMFLMYHRKRMFSLILLLLLLYISGLTGTSGAARFALPIFPFLLIGLTIWPRITASSKKKLWSIRS